MLINLALLMVVVFKVIFLILSILLSVAFLTLLERKSLGLIQKRKGPNKLGVKGILQPFSDAIKLLAKESMSLSSSNYLLFCLSPMLGLGISLILWLAFPSSLGGLEIHLVVIFILCGLTSGVYPLLGAGWASNSKYALLGSLRAVAQSISYEVSLAIILLSMIILTNTYLLTSFQNLGLWILPIAFPLGLVWFTSALAETSRTPFDFSEGESELVSGFNTEYSAGGFVLFFLAEYSSILFMSLLLSVLFLGGSGLILKTTFIAFIFIWVRGTLPRLRYDKLMELAWKMFLPFSLCYLILFSCVPLYSL